jgi:hypothetical protein
MKKLLFIAFTLISTIAFGQNDINRTSPVGSNPANTSTYNKQSVRDANLTAVLNLRIPVYSSFSLRNAKDSVGYVMYNSSIGKMGIYIGGGVWDTISTSNTSSLLNYYTKTQSDGRFTPLTRSLSINGVSYDLNANRSWNVGTVTNVGSGYGLLGGPITSSGTLRVDTSEVVTKTYAGRFVTYDTATKNVNLGSKSLIVDGVGAEVVIKRGNPLVFWDNSNTYDTQIYAMSGTGTNVIQFPGASGTVVLDSDLLNYVPKSRTITVGTGLLGGGDLSTNRTISADTTVLRSTANSLTLAQTQSALNLKENLSNKATDFSTINNTLYPTVQAVKTYADGLVVGLLNDRGSYDPTATSAYPTTGGSGASGAIKKGDIWYISANGTIGGITVLNGYSVRALADSPAQVAANWNILQVGLGYVPENVANKATDLTGPDNTKYPTSLAVSTALDTKQSVLSGTGLVKSTSGTISYITDYSTNWNTAYSYSQVGHLPLTGGTLTGPLNGTSATFTDRIFLSKDIRFTDNSGWGIINPADDTRILTFTNSLIAAAVPFSGTSSTFSDGIGAGITSLSAWASVKPMIESNAGNSVAYFNSASIPSLYLSSNAYFNGTNWVRKSANPSKLVEIDAYNDVFKINSAATGSAGSTITYNPQFIITSAGNVGIGTASPQNLLHVAGVTRISNSDGGSMLYINHGASTGNTYTSLGALIGSGAGWGNLVLQSGGGNVGIGTTSPSYKLQVDGTVALGGGTTGVTRGDLYIDNTSLSAGVYIGRQSTTGSDNTKFYVQSRTGNNVFYVDGGNQWVGIGTTTDAGYKLDVNGTGRFKDKIQINNQAYSITYPTVLGSLGGAQGYLQLGNNDVNYIIAGSENAGGYLRFYVNNSSAYPSAPNGTLALTISSTGAATFSSLAGSGTRMVVADPSGALSTQPIPSGGGGGSVTGIAVSTANGLSGTSDGASVVPTLTLSTTVSGMVKANGSAFSAAVAGTDYTTSSSTETFTNKSGNISQWTNNSGYITSSALSPYAPLNSPTFTGTVSGITAAMVGAPSGSGTSTGTNTGDQTNISGNAGTATLAANSTQWNGALYNGTPSGLSSYMMGINAAGTAWNPVTASDVQGFLGLGSNAYTSTTYAPLNSPGLTGTPTAPTPSAGDNSNKLATTEFIANATGRVLLRSTTTFSGTGLGSSQDYNTGIASGSLLLLTAGSSDAAGAGYYVAKNPGCGGLCDEWHIIFPNGAPIGTSNITFYYVVLQ